MRLLIERRNVLRRYIFTHGEVHFHKDHACFGIIYEMDVKITFLNGVVEEEVYMEQPHVFETHYRTTHVCKLKKALYGLKQAPRTLYDRIDNFPIMSLVFTKSKVDSNL